MRQMNTTLIIMAAGIGSRFGNGIKQLTKLGPSGEIIMDYSIHDAMQAGFNKVVFIIRKEIEKEFQKTIGDRIKGLVDIEYVFQELEDVPDGYIVPDKRKKPWGTGQAVLCCKDIVREPFAVINADDFYGSEAFEKLHEFLVGNHDGAYQYEMCMAGFRLKNTLSVNGGVTRGICILDDNGLLKGVVETPNVRMGCNGDILHDGIRDMQITADQYVSMNMWGGYPAFFGCLEQEFRGFLDDLTDSTQDSGEFLLPAVIDKLVKSGEARVRILKTNGRWFGVTYEEDAQSVRQALKHLTVEGVYENALWSSFRQGVITL